MNIKILSILLILSIFIGADEEKEQVATIEVVGVISFTDETAEIPSGISITEESYWLTKPFKKMIGEEEKSYKISLEGSGKYLLNLVGKRVKIEGILEENEGEEPLFHVQKYEVLLELVGTIEFAQPKTTTQDQVEENKDVENNVRALQFVQESQAAFKYRSPWELEIQGELSEELHGILKEKIRARGTLLYENNSNVFKILRYDKISEVTCVLGTIQKDDDNNIIEARMQEDGSERVFEITLNEIAKDFLDMAKISDKVVVEGIIEGEGDHLTFEATMFKMFSVEGESEDESQDESEEYLK